MVGKKIDDFPRPPETIPDSPGHLREFLNAIKSRNFATTCNVRYGHHLSKCGLLANIAFRTGHRIQWDDERERIAGDNHASQYLARHFRKRSVVRRKRTSLTLRKIRCYRAV
jgi:hypothetical protein